MKFSWVTSINEIEFFDKATGKRVWTLLDMNGGYGAPEIDFDMMDIIFSVEHKTRALGHPTTVS